MYDSIPAEVAAALGLFMGCLARALLPFFRKKHQEAEAGKPVKWEGRYTWTLIFAVFVSFIAATFLFPTFQMPAANVFPLAFALGWASQDILNGLAK